MTKKISLFFVFFATVVFAQTSAFAQTVALAQTETPHPGPRTPIEPKILYDDGITALAKQDFKKAIDAFKRLVNRYPLDAHFIEAHLKLAEAYSESGKPAQAIEPYLAYIKNHYTDPLGNKARLSLTQAYLEAKKYSEARAMVEETLKKSTDSLIHQKALLLKTLTLTRQQKLDAAKASLDAFTAAAEKEATHTADALEAKVRFLLKASQCSSLPDPRQKKSQNEALWVNYVQSVKNCFKESLTQRVIPQFELLGKAELNEWCALLKQKQKHITQKSQDRSFWPKINEAFDEAKSLAKEKSSELLRCYD